MVARFLCEAIARHGICRAVGVSLRGRMDFIVARLAALPAHLHGLPVVPPRAVSLGRLEVAAEAMWSFVAQKANKPWGWIARDKPTRPILAFHVGERRHERARQLWANLPAVSRAQAPC
jgi:hypothetical protein